MNKKKKRLVAHENLIYDVICRQAGTFSKALLEGVMNSIDAGATRIDIKLAADHAEIMDDGKGFKTESEIDEWFAQFGTPHEVDEDDNSTDARYGRFRMGRGQLFAFGRNKWTTNNFTMSVDVKRDGLDFETEEFTDLQHKGCIVEVDLYSLMDAHTLQSTERDICKFCKYVDIDLYLNGDQVNTDPRKEQWDYETDDGWIRIYNTSETDLDTYRSGKGVDIYQQGVFVENIPTYTVGVSGVLITKGPLKLNFARNQVLRNECPRWKRMYKLLKDTGQKTVRRKTNLDTAERSAMIDQLRNGDMLFRDSAAMRLFLDVQNKTWSASQLKVQTGKNTQYELTPARTLPISFGSIHDPKADKIMQAKKAVVFDKGVLDAWEVKPEQFVEHVLMRFTWRLGSLTEYIPLDELDMSDSKDYRILNDNEITPREKMILQIIEYYGHVFSWKFRHHNEERTPRKIRAGKSSCFAGWTDGMSYIALDIKEIRSRAKAMTYAKWTELVRIVLHEYCHSSPDTAAHTHDAHFYQLYHDMSRDLPSMAEDMHKTYIRRVAKQSKKVPQNLQLQALKEAEVIQQGLAVDHMALEQRIAACAK